MDVFHFFENKLNCNVITNLVIKLLASDKRIATAESCTGGMISTLLTSIPGSSNWFEGGVVAYSNDVKEKVLKVAPTLLAKYGAVSEETARSMATGVRNLLDVDYSLAVTGIAGPGGATEDKVTGTVCFAWDVEGNVTSDTKIFIGTRKDVRIKSAWEALNGLLERAYR